MSHEPPITPSTPDDRHEDQHEHRASDRRALLALGLGIALFALAVLAARSSVPEWGAGELPSREWAVERLAEALDGIGVGVAGLDAGDARVEISQSFQQAGSRNPYEVLGPEAADWLVEERRPLLLQVSGAVTTPEGIAASVIGQMGLDGRVWEIAFGRASLREMFVPQAETVLPTPKELLLRPGEALGEPVDGVFSGNMVNLHPVLGPSPDGAGDRPPEYVAASVLEKGPATVVGRGVGEVEEVRGGINTFWARAGGKLGGNTLLLVGVAALAFGLALERRIDVTNAALLTALATAVSVGSIVASGIGAIFDWIEGGSRTLFDVALLFLLWASAESMLRDTGGEATNSLDALRRGRVDRRVGRAALWGLGLGAAAAAVALGVHALATGGPLAAFLTPESASVRLPPFGPGSTPFDLGIRSAGELLLFLALARRVLPARWAAPLAVAAAALLHTLVFRELTLFWADVAVAAVVSTLLLAAYRRAGSLATLVAGITSYLLPAFAFSAHYPGWLGGTLAASSLALVGLGGLGAVGLARGARERRPVEAPPFVARMEEERRVRYEMELLRRMQVGLLPRRTPDVPGWRLAARSAVAHEVGGDFYDFLEDGSGHLWIAAGDVAGHGSFCSISHAMTKAALASLVAAESTPARVLAETDRVLRTLDARRIFTSLALLKLDPGTGRALFANAGYPYPLIRAADGSVREIEHPGLPLGQGPAREYRDLPVELAPGEALVLASDGLVEAAGRDGEVYGFERFRSHLGRLDGDAAGSALDPAPNPAPNPAEALLRAVLARWRETVGDRPLEDDTTVVVLRREG